MENKNRNTAAIGVFDSGVGGLTVTREIMRQLPNENVVYFGDTARVPYGSKSKNNIIRFSRQIIRFLKTKNVKAIVIACNTASALALETVQQEFDIPIIGVIVPGARAAVRRPGMVRLVYLVQKQRSRARPIPKKSGNLCRRQKSSESHVRYSYRW